MTITPEAPARDEPPIEDRKRRFVLRCGVLAWGVTTAVLWTALMCLMRVAADAFTWQRALVQLLVALVLFPIAGYFWGLWTWRAVQRAREAVRRPTSRRP